jgi:SAM-dependent methyltransferase
MPTTAIRQRPRPAASPAPASAPRATLRALQPVVRRRAKRAPSKTTARTADRFVLYEKSVQAPDEDTRFFARHFQRVTGRRAVDFREDFCGTAQLSCHWVKLGRDHRATGVDLDAATLAWAKRHNIAALDEDQEARIRLLRSDVRTVELGRVDVAAALNFSYCVFKTRADVRAYFANVRHSMRPGGLFFVDAWGGSETQVVQEEERRVEDFKYIWEQASFDPLTYHTTCKIHFEFKDGSKLRNAFVYDWRLWTLPELRELFEEAGFRDIHVLWEGTDRATGEGNGVFRRVEKGEPDLAWIAYVVGSR